MSALLKDGYFGAKYYEIHAVRFEHRVFMNFLEYSFMYCFVYYAIFIFQLNFLPDS